MKRFVLWSVKRYKQHLQILGFHTFALLQLIIFIALFNVQIVDANDKETIGHILAWGSASEGMTFVILVVIPDGIYWLIKESEAYKEHLNEREPHVIRKPDDT